MVLDMWQWGSLVGAVREVAKVDPSTFAEARRGGGGATTGATDLGAGEGALGALTSTGSAAPLDRRPARVRSEQTGFLPAAGSAAPVEVL